MGERITLRPHQVPAFVDLIDRGYVDKQMREKYGSAMVSVFESMIATVTADENVPIFVNLTENTVCRTQCRNLTDDCNPRSASVVTREVDAALRLFGTTRIMTGFTLEELRRAVRSQDIGSIL